MGNALAFSKLSKLPAELQSEVMDFIDFLLSKEEKKHTAANPNAEIEDTKSHISKRSSLTPEQEAILDERMEKYEKGHMKFLTWGEVEKRIASKAKNAI